MARASKLRPNVEAFTNGDMLREWKKVAARTGQPADQSWTKQRLPIFGETITMAAQRAYSCSYGFGWHAGCLDDVKRLAEDQDDEVNAKAPRCAGVYFVQDSPPSGPIKIGRARDIYTRLCSLKTANPRRVVFLAWHSGAEAEEAELHELFKEYRIRGEWFEPGPRLVEYILKLVKRDPLGRHSPRAPFRNFNAAKQEAK